MTPESLPQPEPESQHQLEPAQGVNPSLEPLRTPLTPARLSRAELRFRLQHAAFRKTMIAGWVIVAIIYAVLYIFAHQTH